MENISTKEIFLGVGVFFVSVALYFLLLGAVESHSLAYIKDYETALLITDENTFKYADLTNVGNVLAYGQISGSGATLPEIVETYSTLERITERYTQHSRQVCSSYKEDGACTSYRTEYYYTWDYSRKDIILSETYQYLGISFQPHQITHPDTIRLVLTNENVSSTFQEKLYSNYLYEDGDVWASVGDLRYYYQYLPQHYMASMFIGFYEESTIGIVYYEMTQDQVIKHLEERRILTKVLLFIVIVVLALVSYFWIAHNLLEIE